MSELKDLLSLDYAAMEAYEASIERFINPDYKKQFDEFKKDHEEHIKNISNFFKEIGQDYPKGAGLKKILTEGKVVLSGLVGDQAILKAMRSNELETTQSYEQINSYPNIPSNIINILKKGYEDEKKHLEWIEKELDKF
jgi:rubrerythrin